MGDAEYSKNPGSDTKNPEWRTLFEKARVNPVKEGLVARLDDVEAALFLRLQSLSQPGAVRDEAEIAAIQDAARCLKDLRRDLLNYPDWETDAKAGNDRR
jgi:hypothetical protein